MQAAIPCAHGSFVALVSQTGLCHDFSRARSRDGYGFQAGAGRSNMGKAQATERFRARTPSERHRFRSSG